LAPLQWKNLTRGDQGDHCWAGRKQREERVLHPTPRRKTGKSGKKSGPVKHRGVCEKNVKWTFKKYEVGVGKSSSAESGCTENEEGRPSKLRRRNRTRQVRGVSNLSRTLRGRRKRRGLGVGLHSQRRLTKLKDLGGGGESPPEYGGG